MMDTYVIPDADAPRLPAHFRRRGFAGLGIIGIGFAAPAAQCFALIILTRRIRRDVGGLGPLITRSAQLVYCVPTLVSNQPDMVVADCDSLRRNFGSQGSPLLAETAFLLGRNGLPAACIISRRRMLGRQ